MPYQSSAQRRFFHSPGAARAGLSSKQVSEWDAASRGLSDADLPEHVAGKREAKREAKRRAAARALKGKS
jgi:hypothetical protein